MMIIINFLFVESSGKIWIEIEQASEVWRLENFEEKPRPIQARLWRRHEYLSDPKKRK